MYPTLRPGYKRGVLEAIEFRVLTDDAILNNSVIEKDKGLTSNETTGQHGIPRRGSATDPRLGTTDILRTCEECNEDPINCVGHFGHINLFSPIPHVFYFRQMIKILKSTCPKCFRVYQFSISEHNIQKIKLDQILEEIPLHIIGNKAIYLIKYVIYVKILKIVLNVVYHVLKYDLKKDH